MVGIVGNEFLGLAQLGERSVGARASRGSLRLFEHASAIGAWAVSFEELTDIHAGTRGRDRVTCRFPTEMTAAKGCDIQKTEKPSGSSAGNGRREHSISEEIIGHRLSVGRCAGGGPIVGTGAGAVRGALAIFHQPAREHRAGVFVEPLIEQGANLLAGVGGVAKSGEFIGLQRIA
jgi:hypothetical protein